MQIDIDDTGEGDFNISLIIDEVRMTDVNTYTTLDRAKARATTIRKILAEPDDHEIYIDGELWEEVEPE